MTSFWAIFGLIFVAELPDKSAFAAVLLATKNNPWPVFLGTCLAFAGHSALAVLIGSALTFLPAVWIHWGAGLLFIVLGAVMLMRKSPKEEDAVEKPHARRFWKTLAASFSVIFVAEWGDLTQIAIAGFAAQAKQPWMVFSASTLSLCCVSAAGVFLGHKLKSAISPTVLEKVAGALFVVVGVVMLVKA